MQLTHSVRLLKRVPNGTFIRQFQSSQHQSNGVFGMVGLFEVEDWKKLSNQAIKHCDDLRAELRTFKGNTNTLTAPKQLIILDSISNAICSVIDGAELCRNVHPSEDWRIGADESFSMLSSYINELNTDQSMYAALVEITDKVDLMKSLDEEDRRFALALRSEFEKDGIQLPDHERSKLRHMNDNIAEMETEYAQNLVGCTKFICVPSDAVSELDASLWSDIPQSGPPGTVTLVSDPSFVTTFLQVSGQPNVRKALYKSMYNHVDDNLRVLRDLVNARQSLAHNLGHASYAHLVLENKILKTPKEVITFLNDIATALQPKAEEEVKTLLALKQQFEGSDVRGMEQWDVPFYTNLVKLQSTPSSEEVSSYLSLKRVIFGICTLTEQMFGVSVMRSPVPSREAWAPGIEKLTLFETKASGEKKMLGTVYLDLHPRPHKFPHAAHFTVSCGCDTSMNKNQLPVVALVMNFAHSGGSDSFLTYSQLETLLHEFGHAMHSLLSRTKYQHLSGTRVASDFVETPSQLFEYFCSVQPTMDVLTGHYRTNRPLPASMLDQLLEGRNQSMALDTLHQIILALFDMELHSRTSSASFSRGLSEDEIQALALEIHERVMPPGLPAPRSNWMNRFNHLTTYGATYYAYLLNYTYANLLWNELFMSKEGGEKKLTLAAGGEVLWKELFRVGGAKEPLEIMRACIGKESELDPNMFVKYRK